MSATKAGRRALSDYHYVWVISCKLLTFGSEQRLSGEFPLGWRVGTSQAFSTLTRRKWTVPPPTRRVVGARNMNMTGSPRSIDPEPRDAGRPGVSAPRRFINRSTEGPASWVLDLFAPWSVRRAVRAAMYAVEPHERLMTEAMLLLELKDGKASAARPQYLRIALRVLRAGGTTNSFG
jgi:hypothetical protein